MPMHDWTRVSPNDYHAFHLLWIASLATALNQKSLPPSYYAMADHTTPPLARRRVAIKHSDDRELVAVIEIVSPSNKAEKQEFSNLVEDFAQLLRQGIHVLLIDPLPPTPDPDALWKELTGKPLPRAEGKPLTLASYAALGDNSAFTGFVEPLAVGDRLNDMSLFLTERFRPGGRVPPGFHVPARLKETNESSSSRVWGHMPPVFQVTAPLEETYQAAWDGFPEPLRKIVEGHS